MAALPSVLHRLDAVTLYSYQLPLRDGNVRKGLLLCDQKTHFWAEASPLPGRSKETFEQVQNQLLQLFVASNKTPLYPSVEFALQTLSEQKTLVDSTPLAIWALLSGTLQEILFSIENCLSLKFSHLKIKISQLSILEIQMLLSHLAFLEINSNHSINWRLDCNRAFSFEQALHLFSHISSKICIEEPTYEIEKLSQIPFAFAIDETLEELPDFPLCSCPYLTTLILKPTILGKRIDSYVKIAEINGLKVIFTGAYESGIGTLQIATLAQNYPTLTEPLGLSTYLFLKTDILHEPLDLKSPFFTLKKDLSIKIEYLTKICHGICHLPVV